MKPEDDDYPPEKLAALRTVRKLVEFWQILPQELCRPPPPAPAPPVVAASIRYRHPVSGETWDGQGEHPQWLRDALLKEGYTVDELKRAVAEGPSAATPRASAGGQGDDGTGPSGAGVAGAAAGERPMAHEEAQPTRIAHPEPPSSVASPAKGAHGTNGATPGGATNGTSMPVARPDEH